MRSFGMTAAQLKAAERRRAAGPAGRGARRRRILKLGVLLEDRPTLLKIREAGSDC